MRGEWRLAMVLDAQGRVVRWPKKVVQQDAVSAYLARKFDRGVSYTEQEMNAVLEDWHTFSDWALLRRMLWDFRYMERERDGSRYWLAEPAAAGAELRR